MKVGVYFCNCGSIIKDRLKSDRIIDGIHKIKEVGYFKTVDFLCSEEGKEFLKEDLLKSKPDRVVIAACSPRDQENTFMRILSSSGINPYLMQMTNIREQVAWVTDDIEIATEKASSYIQAAIRRVLRHEPLKETRIDANQDVVIIGAGPSGLKAALSIAEAGRKAIVVEKSPAIGGLPVRFEEIFPDMECGSCMLEPLLNDVLHGEHSQNIELHTMSEVIDAKGSFGNFTLIIKKNPRFISTEKCIGCAECIGKCPVNSIDDLNEGLSEKKAVSFAFTGCLPNAPYIDSRICLRGKSQQCTLCMDACPVDGAVSYNDAETIIETNAGAIVIAVGSSLYDCSKIANLGYTSKPDVYTSLEFERMACSSGPTSGEIKTKSGSQPKSFAIIHCAGSLDNNHIPYCSGICCMEAFKLNSLITKHMPDAKISHLYKELSLAGTDEHMLYDKALKNPNSRFIRYTDIKDLSATDSGGKNTIGYKDASGTLGTIDADMIVLCPAVVPNPDIHRISSMLDVTTDGYGFFEQMHGRMDPAKSKIRGVYIAGSCMSPMDIQKAVGQGVASAGYVLSSLVSGRQLEIKPINAKVDNDKCSGCRVCMSLCPFKAITFDADKKTAEINPALCQACGSCVSACPSGAIMANHFTNEELLAEIEAIL